MKNLHRCLLYYVWQLFAALMFSALLFVMKNSSAGLCEKLALLTRMINLIYVPGENTLDYRGVGEFLRIDRFMNNRPRNPGKLMDKGS
jgi:hypothetical protein